MKLEQFIANAQDAITVRRVFGEPYEKDGATFIPAARVVGGGGGGTGQDDKGQSGDGGGFGLLARPAGAFVIRNGDIRWRPAVDPNTLILATTAVAIAVILTRARTRNR